MDPIHELRIQIQDRIRELLTDPGHFSVNSRLPKLSNILLKERSEENANGFNDTVSL